ncbi:hypothetical protein Bca101_020076 [Brassica carinata]
MTWNYMAAPRETRITTGAFTAADSGDAGQNRNSTITMSQTAMKRSLATTARPGTNSESLHRALESRFEEVKLELRVQSGFI